jgi:hypothetical protein
MIVADVLERMVQKECVAASIDTLYTPDMVQYIADLSPTVVSLATRRTVRVPALQRLVFESACSWSTKWRAHTEQAGRIRGV